MKIDKKDIDITTAPTSAILLVYMNLLFEAKAQAQHLAIARQQMANDDKLRFDMRAQAAVNELSRVLELHRNDLKQVSQEIDRRFPALPVLH